MKLGADGAFTVSSTPVLREVGPAAPVIWMEYMPVGVLAVVAIVKTAEPVPLGLPGAATHEIAFWLNAMFEAGGKGRPLPAPLDRFTVPVNPGSQFTPIPCGRRARAGG